MQGRVTNDRNFQLRQEERLLEWRISDRDVILIVFRSSTETNERMNEQINKRTNILIDNYFTHVT